MKEFRWNAYWRMMSDQIYVQKCYIAGLVEAKEERIW